MYLNNPEFVIANGRKYKINTDFRVALEVNEIAEDATISDYERGLAVIFKLYGDLDKINSEDYGELLRLGVKYLKCGNENMEEDTEPIDMDFKQDFRLIQASFMSDYGIDLTKAKLHYWDFYACLNGLTENCVLNRVRELRNYDLKNIKDEKERRKLEKSKKHFELNKKQKVYTEKQKENSNKFYEMLNGGGNK